MPRHPRVHFSIEKRRDKATGEIKEKKIPIRFVVSAAFGTTLKSTTGIIIDKNLWDENNQRVVSSHTHATRLNKQLSDLKKEIEDICYDAWDKEIPLNASYITSQLKKNQRSAKGLIKYFDEFLEEGRDKWQPSTVKKFTTMKNHLLDFGEKKKVRIEFADMDDRFFKKLLDYYFEETKEKPAYLNTYVRKNIKLIKHFLTWATKQGYNKNGAFKKWELETGQKKEDPSDNIISLTIKEFLDIDSMKIDVETIAGKTMDRTRDFLVLACSTGLRFSDISNLKKSDVDLVNGFIVCTTIKTGVKTQIPLNEFSRGILEKHRSASNYDARGVEMAFPTISNQKTNDALKDLGKEAGLTTMVTKVHYRRNQRFEKVCPKYELLSTHIGRKTFITLNIWLGVKAEIIMGMTTHKNHETMESYYKVDTGMMRTAMDQFNRDRLRKLAGVPNKN